MRCFNCQAENNETAFICTSCGASLRPARAALFLDNAEASINNGRYDEAANHLSEADREMLALDRDQREKHLLTAHAFYLQGVIYYHKGLMDEAHQELSLAQRHLEARAEGTALLAKTLNTLGNISYYQDHVDEAIDHYHRSGELAAAVGDATVAARALGNEASMYINRGAIERATELYQRSLEQARLSNEPLALAQSYRVLAWMHSNYGSLNFARDYIEQALAIREQLDDVNSRSLVLIEAGTVYLKRGELAQADGILQEATALLQRTGNRLLGEGVEVNMAELMRQRGDDAGWFSYAMRAFNDAASSVTLKSESAMQLTRYYIKHQDWTHARRHLQWLSTAAQSEDSSNYNRVMLDHIQALLHSGLGEWQDAATCFKQALNSGEPDSYDLAMMWQEYGEMLLHWAEAEDNATAHTEADDALRRAAALFRRFDLPQRAVAIEALLNS